MAEGKDGMESTMLLGQQLAMCVECRLAWKVPADANPPAYCSPKCEMAASWWWRKWLVSGQRDRNGTCNGGLIFRADRAVGR